MNSIENYFKDKKKLVDSFLKSEVKALGTGEIVKAIEYSIFSGGKRVRPILVFSLGEVLKVEEDLIPFAASIEILHTASLIHDDLPIMDDDDYRRGKPTVHKKFNPAVALLSGDAMVSFASEIILKSNYPIKKKTFLISILNKAWGVNGIAGGQALEIEAENGTLVEPFEIFKRKTGALFGAVFEGAAVLKCMEETQLKEFYSIGENIGIVYQINDDLDDIGEKSYNSINFYSKEELLNKRKKVVEKTLKMIHNYKLLKFPFREVLKIIWREENV